MKSVTVTINGKKIPTTDDKTILQVVREHNIDDIPTLCHDDRLAPYGSCFLCVVEVEGVGRLLPSCSTPVSDNMIITTNNGKVREARKAALALLLSNHYADCIGPCKDRCPAGIDIQEYITFLSNGNVREAIKVIKKSNPLPLVCGRVCPHECEIACRRNLVDEAVAINPLKRYAADTDAEDPWTPVPEKPNGKKVAVIGGGPSGLSCAYYLTLRGYKVTIFDMMPMLGGMLRYGIPEYRLPKKILDREIGEIIGLGIDVETGSEIGKGKTLDGLLNDGFDAVYIAVGAWKPARLRLDKEDCVSGIIPGIDFLRDVQCEGIPRFGGIVAVVGGGNTAIDAARTALRCGAEAVKLVYRRSVAEMPAHHLEVEAAEKEGVEFHFLTNPVKIMENGNQLRGIECTKMKLEKAEDGKRPSPVPVAGSEFFLQCDYLISAIGQGVDAGGINTGSGCSLEPRGTISVKKETLETSRPGVFAGGDAVTGPLTAVNAVAQGRQAAESIDRYLKSGKAEGEKSPFYSLKHRLDTVSENEYSHLDKKKRCSLRETDAKERIKNFEEVEKGLLRDEAIGEASRCLQCGCDSTFECELRLLADRLGVDIEQYRGEVRKFRTDSLHPFISLDPNKCINCGRCVRTCSEILGVAALGFVYRGFKAVVTPSMEKPLLETSCISCGNCIDACPTGAISEKLPSHIPGTMARTNHESICHFCSLGCRVNYKKIDGVTCYVSNKHLHCAGISGGGTVSSNEGYLCMKGRFGHRYLTENDRIAGPMILEKNTHKPAGFDESFDITEKRLKAIIDTHGPGAVAVFCSPVLSNEELYLLQKFARTGLGTNAVASLSHLLYGRGLDGLDAGAGITCSTATIDDMKRADVIVTINPGRGDETVVLELQIRKAMKHGAAFIAVDSSESRLAKLADLWVHTKRGSNTALLNGICRKILENGANAKENPSDIEGFKNFRSMVEAFPEEELYAATGISRETFTKLTGLLADPAKKILFVYNIDAWVDKSSYDLAAIGNLLLLKGWPRHRDNGLILLREYTNSQGLLDMGVDPRYLPGFVTYHEEADIKRIAQRWNTDLEGIFRPVDILSDMKSGTIKAALVFGEDPLWHTENRQYFGGLDFLLVSDLFLTETAKKADIILPGSSPLEKNGTYTHCDLTIRRGNAVVDGMEPENGIAVICGLARRFIPGFNEENAAGICEEISEVNRFYRNCTPGESWVSHLALHESTTSAKRLRFSVFDTDFRTLRPEKPSVLFSENYFRDTIKKRVLPLQ